MRNNIPMFSASEARRSIARPATPFWVWLILAGIALSTVMSVIQDHTMRGDIDNPVIGDLLAYQPQPWALQLGRISFVLTFAVAAPVAVLSTFVMSFYGHQYHGGAVILRLIC
jgi:hypothetical protein